MSAHDQVANKEYPLQSVVSTKYMYDGGADYLEEQALRVVYIEKKSDPLVYKYYVDTKITYPVNLHCSKE